jgi:hypothetical protein
VIPQLQDQQEKPLESNGRPCWAWDAYSCTLDSVLLMAMILERLIPDAWLDIGRGLYPTCFYAFRAMVQQWRKIYTSWSRYPVEVMTKGRDQLRSFLRQMDILISDNSPTDRIFHCFIVNQLTEWQFTLVSDCQSPACKADNKNNSTNITGEQSYTPDLLPAHAKWFKNSDTQRVIDQSVSLFLH